MEPRIQYARTQDGVSIAFWTLGQGLPVVQMPPVPWSHIELEWQDPDFRRWYEALARRGMLVRYDNRGSGLSQRRVSDLSPEAMVLDVQAVVDRLGLERFCLVGVAYSGIVAIAYATLHPHRLSHLVLWSGFAKMSDIRAPFELIQSLRGDWELATETSAHAMVAGWSAGEQAHRYAALMRESAAPDMFEAVRGAFRAADVTALLARVRVPTLVIHRRQAAFPDVEVVKGLAARIADARLVLLDGGSLLPYVGDMGSAVGAIGEFLGLPAEEVVEPAPAARGGLATILFTDVEGSTSVTQRLGDARARQVLREHERIVREALRAHGGAEVKTMGDGFLASFGSGTRALECAISLQRAFAERNAALRQAQGESSQAEPVEALRIRVGLNAGEPIAEEDDLFGSSVILAARAKESAQGGEIIVTDVVRQLVTGKGFLFSERGEVALRGFEDPVRLYEVRWQEG